NMSITLQKPDVDDRVFRNSETHLASHGYEHAEVNTGTWILYKEINYNEGISESSEDDIKILSSADNVVDISHHNGSMYLLPDDTDAIVLFKRFNFGGVNPNPMEYTKERHDDITADFPPGSPNGASSAFAVDVNRRWKLFKAVKCVGDFFVVEGRFPKFTTTFNDQVKSLAKE
ncbi:Hypothetical predicted protein, partial [Paramuricea clavata]